MPFREDPAVPALYGAFLRLTGLEATAVVHGIWAFTMLSILSVYGFARSLWGPLAGVLAAGFIATLPISQEILGWHGLANAAALTLLPLLLLYAARLLEGPLGPARVGGPGPGARGPGRHAPAVAARGARRLRPGRGRGAAASTAAAAGRSRPRSAAPRSRARCSGRGWPTTS